MKRTIYGVMAIIFTVIVAYGFQTGITNVTQKPGSTPGCTCHAASPTTSVIVGISGPASLIINEAATYTLTISGGPLVAGGTNIAVSGGTLSVVENSGLRLEGNELTHMSPKASSSGTVSFEFKYTAPAAAGTVTLYANGNSVNLNGQNSGDQWNFAPNMNISVNDPPTGIDDGNSVSDFRLEQNYPNPFNPSTNIAFSLNKASNVKLIVFNAIGDEIAVLVDSYKPEGKYTVSYDAANTPSGIYFYKLVTDYTSSVKKMLLIK